MIKKNIILSICLLTALFSACYYDNENDLYGDDICEDLTATFSGGVMSILSRDCFQCHTNALQLGNVTLEGYENVVPYIENGSFLGSVEQISGFSPMPKDRSSLSDCKIQLIRQWIDEGALNN